MSTLPLLSIGVPVYNGERYLAQALDSALAQDYDNLEILISDNASTDSTADICQRYARADTRVRYARTCETSPQVSEAQRICRDLLTMLESQDHEIKRRRDLAEGLRRKA